MIAIPDQPFAHPARNGKSRFVRPFLTAQGEKLMESLAMIQGTILRVWYGKRLGIPQSLEDLSNVDGAANFAAFAEADRIEVVRETDALPAAEIAA
jgi:hypothetical protein